MDKFREFWISGKDVFKSKDEYRNWSFKYGNRVAAAVHVIEIAAVEQLKADLTASSSVIDILKSDLQLTRHKIEALLTLNMRQDAEIQQLKSKLEVAKKGLEFYADKNNWYIRLPTADHDRVVICESDWSDGKMFDHTIEGAPTGGKTARQALKEIEG